MRSPIKLGGIGLVAFSLSISTPSAQAAKRASSEEQVAVLMKWYRNYFEEGKYKQAEQVAEFAYELVPEDPQITVALKLAQRQQTRTVAAPEVELQLGRVLQQLNRVERRLRDMETQQRRQRTRIQIAKEPPGSPDADY